MTPRASNVLTALLVAAMATSMVLACRETAAPRYAFGVGAILWFGIAPIWSLHLVMRLTRWIAHRRGYAL